MTVLKEFEYEDHTADIKVIGYGNTPKRSIEALMLGILNIIYDIDKVDKKETKEIHIKGKDILEVINKLATKILDVFYIEKFAIGDIRVKHLRKIKRRPKKDFYWDVIAILYGEPYDINKHNFKKEVKAATYHEIDIKKIKKSYWISQIIVDV